MEEYEEITNEEGVVTGYRFNIDIPRWMSRKDLYCEVDWIVTQIEKVLPKQKYEEMSRRGYTIKKEKIGLYEAQILIILD